MLFVTFFLKSFKLCMWKSLFMTNFSTFLLSLLEDIMKSFNHFIMEFVGGQTVSNKHHYRVCKWADWGYLTTSLLSLWADNLFVDKLCLANIFIKVFARDKLCLANILIKKFVGGHYKIKRMWVISTKKTNLQTTKSNITKSSQQCGKLD